MPCLVLELPKKAELAETAIVGTEAGIEGAGVATDRVDGGRLLAVMPRRAETAAPDIYQVGRGAVEARVARIVGASVEVACAIGAVI